MGLISPLRRRREVRTAEAADRAKFHTFLLQHAAIGRVDEADTPKVDGMCRRLADFFDRRFP